MAKRKNTNRYSSAEKRAYWMGVGAGLSKNYNGLEYYDLRKNLMETPSMNDSFSNGFADMFNLEELPKDCKDFSKKAKAYLKKTKKKR